MTSPIEQEVCRPRRAYACRGRYVCERTVAIILEQTIGLHTTEDQDVLVTVVVDVAVTDPRPVLIDCVDPCGGGNVDERKMPSLSELILVQAVASAWPVRDEHVDVTIVVVVEQRDTWRTPRLFWSTLSSSSDMNGLSLIASKSRRS